MVGQAARARRPVQVLEAGAETAVDAVPLRFSKRAYDLVLATIGLVLLSPLFLVIAVVAKLRDPGEIFFAQQRVGLGGRLFKMWKFRTMVRDADGLGPQLTSSNDLRITPLGKFLRRWKLDELPQLVNVLRGEMTLVGPRPEVPYFVEKYSAEQRRVLELVPGVTDPASIFFHRESDLLGETDNAEEFYLENVLSDKLQLARDFAATSTLWSETIVIFRTLWTIARPARSRTTTVQLGD